MVALLNVIAHSFIIFAVSACARESLDDPRRFSLLQIRLVLIGSLGALVSLSYTALHP